MTIYLVMTALVIVLAPLCRHRVRLIGRYSLAGKDLYLALMTLMFALVMGLRALSVGTDTTAYARSFLRVANYGSLGQMFQREANSLPVYLLISRICALISPSPNFHVFVESALISLGLFFFIRRISTDYAYSVLLFVGMTMLYLSMNISRQMLSVVVCANAVVLLSRDLRSIKGWVLFALAVGIHLISLVGLVVVAGALLYRRIGDVRRTTTIFAIIGAAGGSLVLIFSQVITRFFPHYNLYFRENATFSLTQSTGGGRIVIIYIYITAFVLIWLLQGAHKRRESKHFACMVPGITLGMVFGILNARNVLFSRMVVYFMIFFIAFIPWVTSQCAPRLRFVLNTGTKLAFLAYSLLYLMENQSGVVPYIPFWAA